MASVLLDGPYSWSLAVDDAGYREYKIVFRVEADPLDGPYTVLNTPGLPQEGDPWLIDNDADVWAWCRASGNIDPEKEGEPNQYWRVTKTFSNKPPEADSNRCNDNPIEDPLLEPQKISGSFVKFTEEATEDRFGEPILNSAHEMLRGPQVEFDRNRPTIKIEQNVPILELALVAGLLDTVNDSALWGLPARCIKFSNFSWERKFHGRCSVYYTRSFEFDINAKLDEVTGAVTSGFDRDILDEGNKVLKGHWNRLTGHWVLEQISGEDPDETNPAHFIRYKDPNGEIARVILNGAGLPAGVCVDDSTSSATQTGTGHSHTGTGTDSCTETTPGTIHVEKYQEKNLLLLGIPLIF